MKMKKEEVYALQSQISYYVRGHTGKGLVNFIEENLQGVTQIIILKHPLLQVKDNVLRQVVKHLEKNKLELISSPLGKDLLEGVICREKSLAIFSEEVNSDSLDDVMLIDLTAYLANPTNKNVDTLHQIATLQTKASTHFSESLTFHDALEKVYINEMDFKKADLLVAAFQEKLFCGKEMNTRQSIIKKRLFGTNTPDGIVNHLQALIEPFHERIFIKGRAGTGKSVFMKRMVEQAVKYGFDVELYHCSFDPSSLDMVMIRELNCCLFDSTAPHELFPTRDTDIVVDLYESTVTPGTDELYAEKIGVLTAQYKQEMKWGLEALAAIKPMIVNNDMTNVYLDEDVLLEIMQ